MRRPRGFQWRRKQNGTEPTFKERELKTSQDNERIQSIDSRNAMKLNQDNAVEHLQKEATIPSLSVSMYPFAM